MKLLHLHTRRSTSKDSKSTVKSTDWVEVDPEWEPGDNNDHAARKVDADDVEGELPDHHDTIILMTDEEDGTLQCLDDDVGNNDDDQIW